MLLNQASAASGASLYGPISVASDGTVATGSGQWLDVRDRDGEILVALSVGSGTTVVTGRLRSASSIGGADAADITGATFAVTTGSGVALLAVDPKKVVGGFLGFATVNLGAAIVVGVTACAKKKYV